MFPGVYGGEGWRRQRTKYFNGSLFSTIIHCQNAQQMYLKSSLRKITVLTSCHAKGNEEIMHVCRIGTQYPAERVHQPSDYCRPATPTGVNKQAYERSCRGTLKRELTDGVLCSCFLSKSSHEDKEDNITRVIKYKEPRPPLLYMQKAFSLQRWVSVTALEHENKVLGFQGRQTWNK